MEVNWCGHAFGHIFGKFGNLRMDIREERITGPATHFLNGGVADSVEEHCHGSTCSEGMAANVFQGEPLMVESQIIHRVFEGIGYHSVRNGLDGLVLFKVGPQHCVGVGGMLSYVFDTADESADGAEEVVDGFLVNGLRSDSILLVGNVEGCGGAIVIEFLQGQVRI